MAKKRRNTIELDDVDSRMGSRERPLQRNAANARERARMRVLSKAFSKLKTSLPWVPADTKLSKLDTLRLAASYIAHLRSILMEEEQSTTTGTGHPHPLTWPFSINSRISMSETFSSEINLENSCDVANVHYNASEYTDFSSCEFGYPNGAPNLQTYHRIVGQHYLQ